MKKNTSIIYSFLIALLGFAVLLVLTKSIWLSWFVDTTNITQVEQNSSMPQQLDNINDINSEDLDALFEASRW